MGQVKVILSVFTLMFKLEKTMLIQLKSDKRTSNQAKISKTEIGYADFVNSSNTHNKVYARFKKTDEHADLRLFLDLDEVNIIDESSEGTEQLYEIPY